MARNRRRRSRFALEEHEQLVRQLTRDPHLVLAHFKSLGIASLQEIHSWRDICREQPAAAECIRYVAGLLDIPERLSKDD